MTPTEMVLTTTSCTNTHCAMSVAQQLISQSRIWHAVDVMDAKQMAESQAEAPSIPRQHRARIRKFRRHTESAPIPQVAGVFGRSVRQGARAPNADTRENLLLHQALYFRRQSMNAIQSLQKHVPPDEKAFFWHREINNALGFGVATYVPSIEDANTVHDNSETAALEEEYRVLCYSASGQDLPTLVWSPGGHAHQSTSAVSQLDTGHASIHPVESGRTPVNSSSAVNSAVIPDIPDTENQSSSNLSGSAALPGYFFGGPSPNSSATFDNGHDSGDVMQGYSDDPGQDSSGFAQTPTYVPPGQQPLPGQFPLPQQHLGYGFPAQEPTVDPSSSTGPTVPNHNYFGNSSPSEHLGVPLQTGQMAATQPAFQNSALTYNQPPYAAGNSFADVTGSRAQAFVNMIGPLPPHAQPAVNMNGLPQIQQFANMPGLPPHAQPVANVDGPPHPHAQPVADMGRPPPQAHSVDNMGRPPQHGVPGLPQYNSTSAASEIPDAITTQRHDVPDGSSSDELSWMRNNNSNTFLSDPS